VTLCYGIPVSNTTVCSGHGKCISANSCSCDSGFVGPQCQSKMQASSSAIVRNVTDVSVNEADSGKGMSQSVFHIVLVLVMLCCISFY